MGRPHSHESEGQLGLGLGLGVSPANMSLKHVPWANRAQFMSLRPNSMSR